MSFFAHTINTEMSLRCSADVNKHTRPIEVDSGSVTKLPKHFYDHIELICIHHFLLAACLYRSKAQQIFPGKPFCTQNIFASFVISANSRQGRGTGCITFIPKGFRSEAKAFLMKIFFAAFFDYHKMFSQFLWWDCNSAFP